MKKKEVLNVYFENEDMCIRIVSDPKKADIIVNEIGTIVTALDENYKTGSNTLLGGYKKDIIVSDDLEKDISNILDKIGIPGHIKGYRFLREAITMTVNDPEVINSVTKTLYPGVAKVFNTTPERTERAIRHAIEVAFDKGDTQILKNLFGCTVIKGKPTNSEFVFSIADKIRLEQKNI